LPLAFSARTVAGLDESQRFLRQRERSVERVSKIGSASSQALTFDADDLLSFCHEEAAKAVDGQPVETD
jgi:hypothetical protein